MTIYEFPLPAQMNGDQLEKELNASVCYVVKDKLLIAADLTQSEIATVIAKHVPTAIIEPTITQKLASVGLTVTDLKQALGL